EADVEVASNEHQRSSGERASTVPVVDKRETGRQMARLCNAWGRGARRGYGERTRYTYRKGGIICAGKGRGLTYRECSCVTCRARAAIGRTDGAGNVGLEPVTGGGDVDRDRARTVGDHARRSGNLQSASERIAEGYSAFSHGIGRRIGKREDQSSGPAHQNIRWDERLAD